MRAFILASILMSSQAFSGGLEPDKTVTPTPTEAAKAVRADTAPMLEATAEPDCKTKGGNNVTNHGSVSNGGDSVNTKVVCQCETKACTPKVETKVETKYIKSPPKIVEKRVPGPTKVVREVVYVDRTTPGPTVYVDKACPTCAAQGNNKNWSLGMIMGEGPSGVRMYKYGNEYRARDGLGIIMGIDLSYRFWEHWNVGGLYINNDTKMFRAGFNF
jgi:hypothetical protein